jgi:hypothetical protein
MARTNIEEEAHRRVSKLAQLMQCSDREALGTVSFLWTDSQDILATHGTRDQILEWAHLFNASDELCEKWLSALQKSRFISAPQNGEFEIHGNKTQIENRIVYSSRAAKGGKALKKKWKEKKKLEAGLKQASSSRKRGRKPSPSSSKQGSAIQGNSEQEKPVEEAAAGSPPAGEGAAHSVIVHTFQNSLIESVLRFVPEAIQQGWVDEYEPSWLKSVLLKGIQRKIADAGAHTPCQVSDWPSKLVTWVANEKDPLRRKQESPRVMEPKREWDPSAKERALQDPEVAANLAKLRIM